MKNEITKTTNSKQITTSSTLIADQEWKERIQTKIMLAMVNLESLIENIYNIPISAYCSAQIVEDTPV